MAIEFGIFGVPRSIEGVLMAHVESSSTMELRLI